MSAWSARRSLVALITLAVCLVGCRSPEKRVEKRMENVRVQWATNIVHQADLPVRELDWPTARDLMIKGNIKLRQARLDYTNTVDNYHQVLSELIPTLNTRAGISKNLTSLNTISADDMTFSADSFFNVPGLVNYGTRIYVAKMMMYRAKIAYQLAEREQTIELYRTFTGAQDQALEFERLTSQRAQASAMSVVDPFTGRMLETELKTRETASLKEVQTQQQRASDLFGDYRYRWVLTTNGLPDLRYGQEHLPLGDTNRVAQLQMKLFALELEAAKATITGIKLRYWPELNIFITGPPVYQQFRGESKWWDADQVRGSADLYWQLDTRGYVRRQLKQTRRAQELQRARYEQESLALMDRLLFTQQLMTKSQEHLDRTTKELELLLAVPPAQNFLSLQKYVEDYQRLTEQQYRLRREVAEFNALFWFMDEQAWPEPTAIPFK
jgi:hypothetical protein